MQNSDWIAIFALIIASGAFALEIRRWVESGPRLVLSIMVNARTFPHDDGEDMAAIFVTNRGTAPTTLTHFIILIYKSRWHVLLNKPSQQEIVIGSYVGQQIPYELQPNRQWTGMVKYDSMLLDARKKGLLFFGIAASHSDKTARIKAKEPKEITKNISP